MNGKRLAKSLIHGLARMQRAERILKHHLHFLMKCQRHFAGHGLVAVDDPSLPVWVQAGERAQDGRFAGPAFTDQPEGLFRLDRKADALHRIDPIRPFAEADVQMFNLHQSHGSGASPPPPSQAGSRSMTLSG